MMIFLTVGTELPFDRLVRAVDSWCADNDVQVIGQIGDPGPGGFYPRHFQYEKFLSSEQYNEYYDRAELIVAHAGMGAIITALVNAKSILVLPRLHRLREHRNDHQLATARRFADRAGVYVAYDEEEIGPMLTSLCQKGGRKQLKGASEFADERLIGVIREFIFS